MAGYVYIVASGKNGTIYTGVTSDLARRIYEHREGIYDGFSKEHNCKILVHYETYSDIRDAIQREKNIKKWSRAWKLALFEKDNPKWDDLYKTLV